MESITPAAATFRPERLAGLAPALRLAGRNRTKADILLYRGPDFQVAVKDYRSRPFLVRQTLGRLLIRREARAYEAARGLTGLPAFLGRVGPFALACQWIEARPLATMTTLPAADDVFERLEEIVASLHARGIAHGDLHHRDVLVSENGSVFLVDLATAVVLGERPGFLRRALFERLRDADLVALARLRARWTGGDVAAAVAAVGPRAAARHARARRLRALWDRVRRRRG